MLTASSYNRSLFSPSESNQFVTGLKDNFKPLGYNVQVFTQSEMPDAVSALMFYQARFIIFSHDDALSLLLGARFFPISCPQRC